MKKTADTHAQLDYTARVMRPFAPRKNWTWRKKFAFILDMVALRQDNALSLFPTIDGIDAEAIIDARRARRHISRLLRSSAEPYRTFIRLLEEERDRLGEVESIAFLAHYDLMLFRLQHLDTPL